MKKLLFLFLFLVLICPIFVFAEQIDINSATLSQLDEIVHVGPKTAQKIIDDRPYSSVQDLNRVKGIGNGKYLQDIMAQGFACVNCAASAAATASQVNLTPQVPATSQTTDTQNPTPTATIIYPTGIYINEILPNPAGPDELDEWIELYNSNNFNVDLSGWQLQDTEGTPSTYAIAQNTKILAYGFLVFKRPETKIMLNNDKDGLNLLTPDGKIIDSVSFASAPLNNSYNRTEGAPSGPWSWSTNLTPGAKNIIVAVQAVVGPTGLSNTKNSVKNDGVELGLADLTQNINLNQDSALTNPWFLFFIVLAITIILAAIVLFIKLKNHVRT